MKQRFLAIVLCLLIIFCGSGCQKIEREEKRESSGGSGYGAVQKSVLTLQDLYFFHYSATRQEVLERLGTPHESMLTEDNGAKYRLEDGSVLKVVYSQRDTVQTAELTDPSGMKQSLFDYLISLGILKTVSPSGGQSQVPSEDHPPVEELPAPQTPVEQPKEETGYFSSRTYSYALAEQILKEGALRETVLSAFGKPNRYGSVNYQEDGYLIDVYVMEDGSVLYLDYGFMRKSLRAVRKVKEGDSSDYLGSWGMEEKPQGFYRITKGRGLFTSVKKGSTPAALFKRFGDPDWLSGDETHWKAAYQLQNNEVLYFDFGESASSLSNAHILKGDGSIAVFPLR